MTLDELDDSIKQSLLRVASVAPNREIAERLEILAEDRRNESRAIKAGFCPECGHSVTASPSKYKTGVIYYVCDNPRLTTGHVTIRFDK